MYIITLSNMVAYGKSLVDKAPHTIIWVLDRSRIPTILTIEMMVRFLCLLHSLHAILR